MIKKFTLPSIIVVATIIASGFMVVDSSGIAFETNSPYDGGTCNGCHSGGSTTPSATISANPAFGGSGSALTYVPGTTYTITVTESGYSYFGFDIEMINSTSSSTTANSGTMTAVSTNCKKTGTPSNIVHRTPIASSSNAQYKWVAPASGTAYLYAAVLGVNNNGSTNGDKVKNYSYTLTPASTTGIEEHKNESAYELSVFPNPTTEVVNLSYNLTEKANVSVKLYNLNGDLVSELLNQTQGIGKQNVQANLPSDLAKGAYFIRLIVNQQVSTQKLMVY